MQEFSTNALAEVYNLGRHFFHPLSKENTACNCLLCSPHDHASRDTQTPRLVPLPTSTDLDLLKTDSKSIRQLVVLDKGIVSRSLLGFVQQLCNFVHYSVVFNALPPTQMEDAFHVLVLVSREPLDDTARTWARSLLEHRIAKRIVLICPDTETITQEQSLRLAAICFSDYEQTLGAIVHGMMVTKQRLMPKDLAQFLPPHIAQLRTLQQGFCFFY